jgi:hypothetical protein
MLEERLLRLPRKIDYWQYDSNNRSSYEEIEHSGVFDYE